MKLKQYPEDFIVNEHLKLNLQDEGNYSYYILKKRNYNTNDAITTIAKKLKIKPKLINAAGLKDKYAITSQYISIFRGPGRDFEFNDIKLEFLGKGRDRINVGGLHGNEFQIVVRNIQTAPSPVDYVPNYFDYQRFGFQGKNHLIGRHLVKKEFSKATEMFDDAKVQEHLLKSPNDHVGALRKLPKRNLQFLVSAYQSFLWNKAVETYIPHNPGKDEKFPCPGFNIEVSGVKKEILDSVLEEENLGLNDFINRQFPELSCDGHYRRIFTAVHDPEIGELENDGENGYKVTIKFFLERGNYATNVINYMFEHK